MQRRRHEVGTLGVGRRRAGVITAMVISMVVVAAVAVAAIAPPGTQVIGQPQDLEEVFRSAEELFGSDLQHESIPLFSQIVAQLEFGASRPGADPEDIALLTQSYYFRARANANLLQVEMAEDDLRRLLTIAPDFEVERATISPRLLAVFDDLKSRMVGHVSLVLAPADARLFVDGREVDAAVSTLAFLAGAHDLVVERPGFGRHQETVTITGGDTLPLQIELERESAVLKLVTRPNGVRVRVDGRDIGVTAGNAPPGLVLGGAAGRYPTRDFSDQIMVDGLQPGNHVIEMTRDGFRGLSVEFRVPDLGDFDAGGFVLERPAGTVLLRGLAEGAAVTIDGQATSPSRIPSAAGGDGEAFGLVLTPGVYRVGVSRGSAEFFEDLVSLDDRGVVTLNIRLRPSITYLGVLGDDEEGARTITDTLERSLSSLGNWSFLDRSGLGGQLLADLDLRPANLRELASRRSPTDGSIDWRSTQTIVEQRTLGSLYLLAVLSDDLLATHADLWFWPPAPGPSTPDRIRVPLDDPARVREALAGFESSFGGLRPWLGAMLGDSGAAQGPVVFDVTAGGPAATAGIHVGDEVALVAGELVESAGRAMDLIGQASPDASIELTLREGSTTRSVSMRLGSSPSIVPIFDPEIAYAAVWATSIAALASADSGMPGWVAELNLTTVLIQAGAWDQAVRRLRGIRVPSGESFGQAMVDYFLGVALERVGPEYLERAREAFSRAATAQDARLQHRDGPLLAPRALARLAPLGGPVQRD